MKIFKRSANYLLYILLFVLILLLTFIEIIKFPGVVYKYTHIKIEWLLTLFTIFSFLINKPLAKKKILLIFLIIVFTVYVLAIFEESIKFPNYIYSNFHINIYGIQTLYFLLLSTFIPFINIKKNILVKLSIVSLAYWTSINIFGTFLYIGKSFLPIFKNPLASYDDKMRSVWGEFYDCMMLIKTSTPQSSSIYIPPQADVWQMEGNINLVRYFLYPREILHLESVLEASKSANPYIVYSWGYYLGNRKNGAWPNFKFDAYSGVFINNKDNFYYSKPIVFDRENIKYKDTCGVIKPFF